MGKFYYVVRDANGNRLTGFEDGSTSEEIVSRLQAKDLVVINVTADYEQAKEQQEELVVAGRFRRRHNRITSDDMVLFCRQLATLLGAGVTILKSLDIIAMQVNSARLFTVLKNLQKNMEAGLSLHEAMAKFPTVFSELWVNLVESGEASGNLAVVLNRLAGYLERNAAFKKKIISAIIYPALLLCVGLAALLFLTVKIIPTFAELFKGFNIKLPVLTQMLILVSETIRRYFLFFIGGSVLGFFALKKYLHTKEGQKNFEGLQLKLPLFGELFRAMAIERFSSEMSTLIESGVPILYSLEIVEHSVGNLIMSDIIRQIKEEVREGRPLNQPLTKSGFFDPMVVQMVTIGEEIGELSPMFKKINSYYQEYVETFLVRFASMFEPFMLIFMGLIIGIMVIGMFLPIFQISQISG